MSRDGELTCKRNHDCSSRKAAMDQAATINHLLLKTAALSSSTGSRELSPTATMDSVVLRTEPVSGSHRSQQR